MIKKFLKALTKTILIVFLSAAFLLTILQNNQVQSYMAKAGSAIISKQLGVDIWIEKLRISGFFKVSFYNILLKDHHQATLLSAKSVKMDLPLMQGMSDVIPINKIQIDSAFFHLKKYQGEENLNLLTIFNSENDTSEVFTETDSLNSDISAKKVFKMSLAHLIIKSTHFIYEDADASQDLEYGMDYAHLDISNIDLEMKKVELYNDSILAQIIHLGAKEKCGIELIHLEALANVSSKGTYLKGAKLQTPRSKVSLDLGFDYNHWSAYLDFIDDVKIESTIMPSQLNLEDISYFAPPMHGMDNLVRLQGIVTGPIRNLKAKKLQFSFGSSTNFKGNAQISGLPDIYESFINLKIQALSTNVADLRSFRLPFGETLSAIPSEIEKFGNVLVKGRYTGFYNDFVSNADIYTELGKLYTNIQFQNNSKEKMVYYNGDFKARDFNLGAFLEMEDDFGAINFDVDVKGKGFTLETLETEVIGRIDSLVFRNNQINTIFVDALVQEKQFLGALHLEDNLINAEFNGIANFDTLHPYFDFKADFKDVKLAQLKLLDIDPSANLTSRIRMNFSGDRLDEFDGNILIDSTQFFYADKNYALDSLHVYSTRRTSEEVQNQILIRSDYLNGYIKGKYSLESLSSSIGLFVQNYLANIDFVEEDTSILSDDSFQIDFVLNRSKELTSLFIPSLVVPDTVFISGHFHQKAQDLLLETKTKSFRYKDLAFQNFDFKLNTTKEKAYSNLNLDRLVFKEPTESDSLELGVDNIRLSAEFLNNIGSFDLSWYNVKTTPENKGDIIGAVHFLDNNSFLINLDQLDVVVNDSVWQLTNPSSIAIDSTTIQFDSLSFASTHQSILLNGAFAEAMDKSFGAHFNDFDIAALNLLLHSSGISLHGNLTGDFQLIDAYQSAGFLTDMKLKGFVLNGEKLGDAEIKSTWNSDQSIFLNINLAKAGNKGTYKPLYLEGYYYPGLEENQLDIDIFLHNLKLNFLNPFLESFVSDLEGSATGEIYLGGSLKEPDLQGHLDLARTQFRIIYLNTLYSMSGTLNLDNQMLGFNQVSLYDTVGNVAELSGGLTHQRLRNFGVDLKVSPLNFVALNTIQGMNELFYGKAVVSGDVFIKGPFDNIFLDIDAKTNRGTDLKIPINTTLGVSENSFIVFVNNQDSSSNVKDQNFVPQLSSFSLNMDVNITPEAKVQISLPAQLGEIQATGFGDLNMNLSRTGNFRMSGDYRVSNGLFYFRIRNILNRRFELNEGGTISWTGDPYSGVLGMSANYQLKTSLNSLGLDQDSSYRNRVPVDCVIGLTGPIMDPNIKFKFKFPNATEEVKQYVYSKIDTTNSSEMSQQMLSLLVFNSFSFNNGTGDNSLANNVTGSSMQIVANQLSNWLSQISKDVDIGINYRPGGQLTNEEVEVALSTQLFDERVTIDGNFGYQNVQDNPSANASSIVGDINVEVKITPDGRLRLKAFNRTNTVDLLDNTSPYTQGVGIFYRKEFNNLSELFTNQRKQEREKKKAELEKLKARMNEEEDTKVPIKN